MTVIVKKLDAHRMMVRCNDFDFLVQLREYFRFRPDRYQFMPSFKSGYWDGYINLLEVDGVMMCGLLQPLIKYCEGNNHQIIIDPEFTNRGINISRETLVDFISKLDLPFEPYEYQIDGLLFALQHGCSLLESCTSSGKSIMQYLYLRCIQVFMPNMRAILVVPTAGLVLQMYNDFKSYETSGKWTVNNCYKVKGKEKCKPDKPVTITTFQSMNNAKTKPKAEFFHQFDVAMVDEVHRAESESVNRIIRNCINANWRLGVTGSFKESKTHIYQLMGMFGETKVVMTTHELIALGRAAKLNIHMGILGYPPKLRKLLRNYTEKETNGKKKKIRATYQEEIEFVTKHEGRARMVCGLAGQLKGNTIIMVNLKEHGQLISQMVRQMFPNRIVYDYNGDVKTSVREEIRQETEKNDGVIIIGSLGTISTGISIKRLDNLIFAHPVKSKIYTLQSIGRLLRMVKDAENIVNMYDLVDDFSSGTFCNYAYEHAKERARFYDEGQLPYDMMHIDMEPFG